ncbi:PucR family transcriptional regulator [Aeribacillus sp. FSL M8-0254]|jgi:PucR family transcriptional regulator, proline-responsive transcriptional activator|uniref:PucR family transcriptional regulator n=1 Tax=Aeribacillus sp. FSL M8-0254 TaxID=2954577 RepID=UPI0030F9C4A5
MTTIRHLLLAPEFQHLQLIAGKDGLNRKLSGINVIESDDLIQFCRANELIVTTGIQMKNNTQMLERLVKRSFDKKVAGVIINVGPYIPEVPPSIIEFADNNHFPLIQMEWKYRVADLLKKTFAFISMAQKEVTMHQEEEKILYNLLFRFKHLQQLVEKQLQKRGISKGAELGIIVCTTKNNKKSINQYFDIILYEFQNRYHDFLSLKHDNQLIFLIDKAKVKTNRIPFSKTVEKIYNKVIEKDGELNLIIGMGNFYNSLGKMSKSYNEALTVIFLSQKHRNPFIFKYKEIGAYKIILSVPDHSILKTFHQDMLGPLYLYDELHETDFVDFLRIFLEENGSANKISKRLFIHRNTVTYKIRKIETLLDVDLNNTFARTNLSVAFMIENILNQNK